jgi:hypothetical protein
VKPGNKKGLADRVHRAAEAALAEQDYVAPIDVLLGVGWLDPNSARRWRQGRVGYLEGVVQANLNRVSTAMKLFRSWAEARGLRPSETDYVARAPGRPSLRFSKSGAAGIERAYRTHWVSPELGEKKRARLEENASRPPELVAISPVDREWTCHRCGGTGDLLMMEEPGPACLDCVGLGDLVFLPRGDARLTRMAREKSGRYAVVVRFHRKRRRYERQGLMVEPDALAEAERAVEGQASD